MRPIDADSVSTILTRIIEEQKKSHHDDEVIGLMEARTEVNNALTLDVKPVKYTTWYVDRELYTHKKCKCLRCRAILDYEMIDYAYCPKCGAEVIDPEEEYERAADGKDTNKNESD